MADSAVPTVPPRVLVAFGLSLLFFLALMTGTHWPENPIDYLHREVGFDKIYHAVAYSLVTILCLGWIRWWAATRYGCLLQRLYLRGILTAVCASLVAMGDELTQPLTGRRMDGADLLADLLGIATVVAVYWGWRAAKVARICKCFRKSKDLHAIEQSARRPGNARF